ncbi:MAG: DUF4878 domain-containing protein [Campylobacteraceae bacterium]|nr:DUF4878 domain-containing protein [Campylobacteraceae bacterium]
MRKLLVAIMAVFMFVGCGESASKAEYEIVKNTATKFINHLYKDDAKSAVKMIYLSKTDEKDANVRNAIDDKIEALIDEQKEQVKKRGGFKSSKVVFYDIYYKYDVPTEASVSVEVEFKDGTSKADMLSLVKNDKNEWKIKLY